MLFLQKINRYVHSTLRRKTCMYLVLTKTSGVQISKKKISSSSPEISNFECFSLTKNRDSKKSKKKNVEKSKFQVPSLMSE